jgi:helix-turn-helix protein
LLDLAQIVIILNFVAVMLVALAWRGGFVQVGFTFGKVVFDKKKTQGMTWVLSKDLAWSMWTSNGG